jgi:glycosyltransferase involved in cell wall biosynthesis
MMSSPLFSVILPTYNRAAMLRTAIRSVLAQTFADYECFVIDDGSTDRTPAVFEEFKGERRLRLHRFEDNRRQHVRRNFAITLAHGAFVTFLDSDDLWLPRRLELFAEAIRERPETGFWFSNAYLWRYGRVVGTVFDPERPIPEGRVPGWYAVGDRFLPYLTSNLAVSRGAFERVGRFREDMKILEDTELYARMLASGLTVGVLRMPLAVRRLHEAQITHDYAVDFEESLLALQSGGAPTEEFEAARHRLALEIAAYFVKGLQPQNTHDFLRRHAGHRGSAYWRILLLSLAPRALLKAAKDLRAEALALRHHPWFAPKEFERVRRYVEALG